jgi:hypothetical protein
MRRGQMESVLDCIMAECFNLFPLFLCFSVSLC